jgi:hypothetical protein
MPRTTATSHRRLRVGVLALVAALAFVAAACDVPIKPAGGLFDSWKGNDADGAHSFATDAAVDQIFAKTYSAKSEWFFDKCEGTAGSTYCTWINNIETRLQMRVGNSSNKVVDVQFIALSSGISGRFFHAWRSGDHSAAANYGTATAVSQLYSRTYSASDHWTPQGCDGAAGSIYCTWSADDGRTIVTHFDNVETHKVVSVAHHAA